MKIAICDDDSAYVKKIESVVRTTLAEKNIDARFDLISDSAQLHDSAETYDMAFLDIGMTPYNGLEIAARLKKRNRNIIIFFITSYDDYIDDAWICTFSDIYPNRSTQGAQSGSRKSAEAHRQGAHKLSCERERKSRVCLLKRYCFC